MTLSDDKLLKCVSSLKHIYTSNDIQIFIKYLVLLLHSTKSTKLHYIQHEALPKAPGFLGGGCLWSKIIFVDLDKSYKPIFSESKNINQKPRYRDLKFGSTIEIHRASKLKMVTISVPFKVTLKFLLLLQFVPNDFIFGYVMQIDIPNKLLGADF